MSFVKSQESGMKPSAFTELLSIPTWLHDRVPYTNLLAHALVRTRRLRLHIDFIALRLFDDSIDFVSLVHGLSPILHVLHPMLVFNKSVRGRREAFAVADHPVHTHAIEARSY